MGHEVTIGGERLGSGKRMKAYLHNYERSTHDLSYIWRSTMAAGTLVPFMKQLALPGDTFDIELNTQFLTHPTIGPLFGTYKIQLDVFQVPIRLYQGKLHMNMLGIGMDMSQVPLPKIEVYAGQINKTLPPDNQQINPSCILSYLGIRGIGIPTSPSPTANARRYFNAVPYLAYWDIYKNYYANKQEEIGACIHKSTAPYDPLIASPIVMRDVYNADTGAFTVNLPYGPVPPTIPLNERILPLQGLNTRLEIQGTGATITNQFDPAGLIFFVKFSADPAATPTPITGDKLFDFWDINPNEDLIIATGYNAETWPTNGLYFQNATYLVGTSDAFDVEPKVVTFPLENIDTMRRQILAETSVPFIITPISLEPYNYALDHTTQLDGSEAYSKEYSQEGLAVKTYQSDLFNNWISTEWIDGPDGISELTAVDTSSGSFTIDELNMSKKIYDMLNRIAISGGSYDDWLDAVYTHDRQRSAENPMYIGGLIRNLVFDEVVSNSATPGAPLGTLAGRGKMGNKDKGGHIVAKIDEPSYIIGIVSLTPNIDYSQGNDWDNNLVTLNDLHKPALDEIGFQDLITDQMAWFDTSVDGTTDNVLFRSAGKQPAWINYMTNVNKVYGNFAEQTQQMFMVLNRRYDADFSNADPFVPKIKDLTTYIDPSKFNHIFADTRRDAQNFWAQIACNITARRKMSAKVMPNL